MRTLAMIAAGVLLAQDPPRDEAARKAERLKNALLFYADPDPGLRDAGRKELVALGKDALTSVEDLVAAKGALDLANILREIDRAAAAKAPAPSANRFVTAKEVDDPLKDLPKPDPAGADRYVHAKYAEAVAHQKRGGYQKSFEIAKALETLEPRSPLAEKIRLLRRHCETMITQTTLLEAKLLQEKIAYVAGEPVELTMRLRNLFRSQMTLSFEKEGGQAVLEIEASLTNVYNAQEIRTGNQVVKCEAEIPIATGAQWERKFVFNADLGFTDQNEVRVLTVNAWMQPLKLEVEGKDVTRRIQFQPAVVRIVPAKYRDFVENPLEWLGKTIDTGRPAQETYVCAQLLDGERKDMGIEVLIRAMERTQNHLYRESIAAILGRVTGEKLGLDPKKWAEWNQGRGKKPR
jgi:hypothetical protein